MTRADGVREPEKVTSIDAEYLSGKRFPYQEHIALVEDIDLDAATPGKDLNWLEDVELLEEEGTPAVFDRYSNSFLRIYFPIPSGREDEIARKVLIAHLTAGNSYGIRLKRDPRQVRPARARPVGRGLADRRRGLEAARARGLGAAGALTPMPARARLGPPPGDRGGRPRAVHGLAPGGGGGGGPRGRQGARSGPVRPGSPAG